MDHPTTPVTRYTTPEEKANIAGIDLNADDVDYVMDLVKKGLVGAAALHEAAVQEDMALGANVTVALTRGGIAAEDGGDEELTGTEEVTGTIRARKIFLDPAQAPENDS
ncbi:hypothetical protein ADK76_10820 [Streptomyces griseoflavus]|uniref:hypothetical protein n=1 Tax=Streptomyces rimosus TaxID=1927 RepID=UPI0004CA31B1|nr:hypothetical protein [Streptomyces rimosus]KOG63995.1 hypothetical protein ADK76_10820 [Streptomyces griseoflavus]